MKAMIGDEGNDGSRTEVGCRDGRDAMLGGQVCGCGKTGGCFSVPAWPGRGVWLCEEKKSAGPWPVR